MLNLRLEIDNTDLLAGTNVYHFSSCLGTFIEVERSSYCIRNIDVIACLLPIAKYSKNASLKCTLQHSRDNAGILLIILPGAIIVKRAHHKRIHTKRGGIG